MENRAPSIMENDTERGEHSIRPCPPYGWISYHFSVFFAAPHPSPLATVRTKLSHTSYKEAHKPINYGVKMRRTYPVKLKTE